MPLAEKPITPLDMSAKSASPGDGTSGTQSEARYSLSETIRRNPFFVSVFSLCSVAIVFIAFRKPLPEIERYREDLAETSQLLNAKLAEKDKALDESQKELTATQTSLIATEKALSQNIDALREVQDALQKTQNRETVHFSEILPAAISPKEQKSTEVLRLKRINSDFFNVQSDLVKNRVAYRETAEALAKARFDLAQERLKIKSLRAPNSEVATLKINGTWEDYLPQAAVELEHQIVLTPAKMPDAIEIPDTLEGIRDAAATMSGRLEKSEKTLADTQTEIHSAESELTDTQSEITSARAEIARLVEKTR